jgi:hypothetical protein
MTRRHSFFGCLLIASSTPSETGLDGVLPASITDSEATPPAYGSRQSGWCRVIHIHAAVGVDVFTFPSSKTGAQTHADSTRIDDHQGARGLPSSTAALTPRTDGPAGGRAIHRRGPSALQGDYLVEQSRITLQGPYD